eukprot:CAMPEP_0172772410 /NCGR_PEP_ID=MMETSP1074-20121228/192349_1 /TAXON_ID=2916 /ORGANISM="Ceratium fusus, Strain PA161109" /LENGTH=45 /DNA_ID= /DNA_START= /DNA_END= /DNA_ORIENTATION=
MKVAAGRPIPAATVLYGAPRMVACDSGDAVVAASVQVVLLAHQVV